MIGNIRITAVVQNLEECRNGNATANCTAVSEGQGLYFDQLAVGAPAPSIQLAVSNTEANEVTAIGGNVGDILFFDVPNNRLVTRLTGSAATAQNVAKVISEMFASELDANGNYQGGNGSVIPSIFPGGGNGFGFGLFNVPYIVWWLIAAYGVKKLTERD